MAPVEKPEMAILKRFLVGDRISPKVIAKAIEDIRKAPLTEGLEKTLLGTLKRPSNETAKAVALRMADEFDISKAAKLFLGLALSAREKDVISRIAMRALKRWSENEIAAAEIAEMGIKIIISYPSAESAERFNALASRSPTQFAAVMLRHLDDPLVTAEAKDYFIDFIADGIRDHAIAPSFADERAVHGKILSLMSQCRLLLSNSAYAPGNLNKDYALLSLYETVDTLDLIRRMLRLFNVSKETKSAVIRFITEISENSFYPTSAKIAVDIKSPASTLYLIDALEIVKDSKSFAREAQDIREELEKRGFSNCFTPNACA